MVHDIGLILKKLRLSYGLTQDKAARKLNVSKTTIAGWENDFKYPSVENLIKLAQLYHVPLNLLVGIQKENSISLNGLSNNQQKILIDIVAELQSHSSQHKLSEKQKRIITDLLDEFYCD